MVDRTFLCAVARPPRGYPDPGVRSRRIRFSILADLENPGNPGGAAVEDQNSGSLVTIAHGPAPGSATGGVWVNRRQCTWLKSLRLPLSRQGLRGHTGALSKAFECVVPRRIVVRARATLARPANWIRTGDQLMVRGNILQTHLAVRTFPARKPLALGIVDKESRLFVSRRCVEDNQ
jgi:hypothetical protein